MKLGFYPKLALTGISKNHKIYVPYILTCIGMVMMFYIISFLSTNKSVATMPGGSFMQMILMLGCGVMGFFSLIFLFYTNSFLIRKRKKEFGLYNILGMGKRNLARILVFESMFIAATSLAGGLLCGILFSKIAELLIAHILGGKSGFAFTIGFNSIMQTLILFAVIFSLILIYTLRQIHVAKPVELLQSDTVGEKPPKSNWILAILGVFILAVAYYIALSVKEEFTALFYFFIAVILVIIATYLLFIAGSVVFCRLLQKNKYYYYKTSHFVSVSSMVYRMKRNGAGLASICILSTMVLVMLSSTVCLYMGAESSLRSRYPRSIVVDTFSINQTVTQAVDAAIGDALMKNGAQEENPLHYRYLDLNGMIYGNRVLFDQSEVQPTDITRMRQLFIVPLEDYNRLMGADEKLSDDEVMLYCTKSEYIEHSIALQGLPTMKVRKVLTRFVDNGVDAMQVTASIFVIVPDFNTTLTLVDRLKHSDESIFRPHDYYGFDLTSDLKTQTAIAKDIEVSVQKLRSADDSFPSINVESAAKNHAYFYALYGGLLFLGILLGIVFILGAVLIMYYKQITEGYEDQGRFDVMQKVGMTKREIKKSVNSQVLTVFFLPLVTAGIHMVFAFPMISKLLALFSLTNIRLFVTVTICCYLIFALFYTVVYFFTSRAYYNIVSSLEKSKMNGCQI